MPTASAFSLGPLSVLALLAVAAAALLSKRALTHAERLVRTQVSAQGATEMFGSSILLLVGLYYVVKTYYSSVIPLLMRIYYAFCLALMLVHLLRPGLIRLTGSHGYFSFRPFVFFGQRVYVFTVDLASVTIAVPAVALYWFMDNWIVCDVLAWTMSIYMVDMIRIPSLKIGTGLMAAFFAYDVYFVFFSDIMLTVAKTLNIPAKLLFPRTRETFALSNSSVGDGNFAMLGLGDIILPGCFIAFVSRLEDAFNSGRVGPARADGRGPVRLLGKALAAYAAAVGTAMGCLTVFRAAQPVLLYIVPYIVATTLAALACHGRDTLRSAWEWSEDDSDADEDAASGCSSGASNLSRTPSHTGRRYIDKRD